MAPSVVGSPAIPCSPTKPSHTWSACKNLSLVARFFLARGEAYCNLSLRERHLLPFFPRRERHIVPNSGSKRGIFCPRRGRERLSVRGAWESQFGKRQEQPAMQWGWHHLADNQACSILVAVFWSKYYCGSILVAVFWLKYSANVRTQECRSPFGTLLLIH